jgi:hypothetical protein
VRKRTGKHRAEKIIFLLRTKVLLATPRPYNKTNRHLSNLIISST